MVSDRLSSRVVVVLMELFVVVVVLMQLDLVAERSIIGDIYIKIWYTVLLITNSIMIWRMLQLLPPLPIWSPLSLPYSLMH